MQADQGQLVQELFAIAQWDLTSAVIRLRLRRQLIDDALVAYFGEQASAWSGLTKQQLTALPMLGAIGLTNGAGPTHPDANAWVVLYQAAHRVAAGDAARWVASGFAQQGSAVLRGQVGAVDAMRLLSSADSQVSATMEMALGVIAFDPAMLGLVGQTTRATAALVVPMPQLLDYVATSHRDPLKGLREAWVAALGEARATAPLDPEQAKQLLVRALDYSTRTPEPHDDLDTIIALLQLDRRVLVPRDVEWCLEHLRHLACTGNVAPHAATAYFVLDHRVNDFGLQSSLGPPAIGLGHDLLKTALPPEEWKALAAHVLRADLERGYTDAAALILEGFRTREAGDEPSPAYVILHAEASLAQGDVAALDRMVDYSYRRIDPGEEAQMLAAAVVLDPRDEVASTRGASLGEVLGRVPKSRRAQEAVKILTRHERAHPKDRVMRLADPVRSALSDIDTLEAEAAIKRIATKPTPPEPKPLSAGPVATKHECLHRIQTRQRKRLPLRLRAHALRSAGDVRGAAQTLVELLAVEHELLRLTRLHDENYAPPLGVEGVAIAVHDTLLRLSSTYDVLGDRGPADAFRADARELAETDLGEGWLDGREIERVPLLTSRGRFATALDVLARCGRRALTTEDAFGYVRTVVDEAELRLWLGDVRLAHERLEGAVKALDRTFREVVPASFGDAQERDLKLAREVELGQSVAANNAALYQVALELRYFRARAAQQTGDYNKAEDLFLDLRPEYEALGLGAVIDFELAQVEHGRGNKSAAQSRLAALAEEFEQNDKLASKRVAFLRTRARLALERSDADKALKLGDRALGILVEQPDAQELWRVHALRGEALRLLGREHEALGANLRAIEAAQRLRYAPLGFRLDSEFLADKRAVYDSAVTSAVETDDATQACRLIEMIKGKSLSLVLSVPAEIEAAGAQQDHGDDDALSRKYAELSLRADGLAFDRQARRASPGASQERQQLLRERDSVFQKIRTGDPRWKGLRAPEDFDLDAVRRYLAYRDYRALQLFRDGSKIHAILIAPDGLTMATKQLTEQAIGGLTQFQMNLAGAGRPVAGYDRLMFDPSVSLYLTADRLVPNELLDSALSGQGLVISPIGDLHLLPWASLVLNNRRLFQFCPVSTLPKLGLIPMLAIGEHRGRHASIVGPPHYDTASIDTPAARLEELEGEVEELRALYGGDLLGEAVGADATRTRMGEILAHPHALGGVLHLACHASFSAAAPLTSALTLADGKLDVGEVSMMPIDYADVVLSACAIGWRGTRLDDKQLLGDDMLGIPGAFLEAGASSVLASVSPPGDRSSRELMVEFHRARRDGQTPMRALQTAQLGLLLRPELAPCQWVGFNLYGSE